MGLAIHYTGWLKSPDALDELARRVRRFAEQEDWVVTPIDAQQVELIRVKHGRIAQYVSDVKGLIVQPHVRSEPVRLLFDEDWYMQESTKTQFCPVSVHVRIVELLRVVQDLFEHFEVLDEGKYWETGNLETLRSRHQFLGEEIQRLQKAIPGAEGPGDVPDRRLEDPQQRPPGG